MNEKSPEGSPEAVRKELERLQKIVETKKREEGITVEDIEYDRDMDSKSDEEILDRMTKIVDKIDFRGCNTKTDQLIWTILRDTLPNGFLDKLKIEHKQKQGGSQRLKKYLAMARQAIRQALERKNIKEDNRNIKKYKDHFKKEDLAQRRKEAQRIEDAERIAEETGNYPGDEDLELPLAEFQEISDDKQEKIDWENNK